MSFRVAGSAWIEIDGEQFETRGSFSMNPGTEMREPQQGTSRFVGYKGEPQAPSIECKIIKTPGLSIKKLAERRDMTVTVEGPTGETFVLRKAYQAGSAEYDTEEGEITCKFVGESFTEV